MIETIGLHTQHDTLRDPYLAATEIAHRYPLVDAITVATAEIDFVTFELRLKPYTELVHDGYGTETVRISVFRNGNILAIPIGPDRRWKHRFPEPFRQLCLWYPNDPPMLRWNWSEGLVDYVAIVHRHLLGEEFWRRTGDWPGEDAPHSQSVDGAHPILSLPLRLLAGLGLQ